MTPLVISHSIFLTSVELAELHTGKVSIKTVGITVPVRGDGNGVKLTEVFCEYLVTNEDVGADIELTDTGYKFNVKNNIKNWSKVEDAPEDANWMFHQAEHPITFNGVRYSASHQILIQSVSDLERSTVCENLSRYLNQKKIV